MNTKPGFLEYASKAAAVVLTALTAIACYASVATMSAHGSAQGSISGEWIIEMKPGSDIVYLSIHRRSERGGSHSSSSNIRADSLKGLTAAQVQGSGSAVTFQIVREAGVLNCEGWFKEGKGSGSFTFLPNQGFAAEMRSLGHEQLSDEKLFAMAVHDVGLTFIRELIHGVKTEFIKGLQESGYRQPPIDQLIAMRIHGVKNEFIKELRELGYEQISIDQLVAMRIHGVSTEFVKEIKAQGYDRVSPDQLVAMRIHGVSSAFIEKAKSRGYSDASINQLIELKIRGFEK